MTKIDRDAVARAVHRAVCGVTRTDGFGCCQLYAAAGLLLLRTLMGKANPYHFQAGGLYLCPDPADPEYWISLDPRDSAAEAGELHCWLARPLGGPQPVGVPIECRPEAIECRPEAIEYVDLTARFYARYTTDLTTVASSDVIRDAAGRCVGAVLVADTTPRKKYGRPPLPYVWHTGAALPEWVNFRADAAATALVAGQTFARADDRPADKVLLPVARAALRFYRDWTK
jgi:hypothetical protein